MVGLKKKETVTYAKISPKNCEPQRYSWGTQKKKKKQKNKKKHTLKRSKINISLHVLYLSPLNQCSTTNHSDGVTQGWSEEGVGWGDIALLTTVMVSRRDGVKVGGSTTNHSDGVAQGWGGGAYYY